MISSSMLTIVLVTHAPLGQALYLGAEHVLQSKPQVLVADIQADELIQPWVDKLTARIQTLAQPYVLILCDLYGSTPYHITSAVQRQLSLKGQAVHVVSGVNLSMLVKALTSSAADIDQYIAGVLHSAQRAIVHQAPTLS